MVASMNNLSIGPSSKGSTVKESHTDLEGMGCRVRELTIDVPSESKGRAKYFGDKAHRQAVGLKDKEVAMEFCNGLLGTSPSLLSILYPSPSSSSSTVAIVLTSGMKE
jgi:hypothetical protein